MKLRLGCFSELAVGSESPPLPHNIHLFGGIVVPDPRSSSDLWVLFATFRIQSTSHESKGVKPQSGLQNVLERD